MNRSTAARETDYQSYLRSDVWKVRRAKVFAAAGGICLGCGRRAETVHHRSYERLGQEADADLVALCWDCHQACHLHHVEHADMGLWRATNAAIAERRILFGLPPVRLPRERRARSSRPKRKSRGDQGRRPAQNPTASPVRVAIRSVPCPKCGAAAGQLCLAEDGIPRRGGVNHGRRVSAYGQQSQKPEESAPMRLTAGEIEAARTARGGWTKAQLATWGVPWPPPAGWRKRLICGDEKN